MADNIQQSLTDIEKLIQVLTDLQGKLDSTSKSFEKLDNLIKQLGTVTQATSGLARLAEQAQKLTSAIETGAGGRVRMGGFGRINLERILGEAGVPHPSQLAPPALVPVQDKQVGTQANAMDQLKAKLESYGLTAETVTKIMEKAGQSMEKFGSVSLREGKSGLDTITVSFRNSADAAVSFSKSVDHATGSLVELGQATSAKAINPITQLSRGLEQAGMSLEQRRGFLKELSGLTDLSKVQGVSSVRVEPGLKVEGIEGEFTKLSGTIKAAEGILIPFNKVVSETGQVFNQLPKAIQASSVSMENLTKALGGSIDVSNKALQMAQKYGFALEHLKTASTEGSTGITRLNFSMEAGEGVYKKLSLVVDKFGNVLTDTQKRFRGFAEGIVRNIGEAFKWTVAISAIYAPLRKLQDLVETSIKNEAELANIGVILGKGQEELGAVFNSAAEAAAATGENISGVLEGYVQAYRATGNIRGEAARAAVAQQLLVDSLVLSKLSALDQAGAMDTLVGALNQVGLGLDEGVVLLDKWVAVSKRANVDIATLAESFAITSTSAENAGLTFDELNGIIATVAENTTLSATEAGNAVRAFISGIQTGKAKDTLGEFGISAVDAFGKARDFMDVMEDIATLRVEGMIDSAQLNKIGEALGGGARRGAQYVAFLENLGRVQEIAAISANAQGDAYDAVAIQLTTAQTALTELNNSFQILAQTVGGEGGVLSIFKFLLDVSKGIVGALTEMTKALGSLTPLLTMGGGILAYAGVKGRLTKPVGAIGSFAGGMAERMFGSTIGVPGGIGGIGGIPVGETVSRGIVQNAPAIGVGIATAIQAAMNIAEKDYEGLFGQVIGAAFGAVVGGPYGALIGSVIGDTFANTVFGYETEFADFFKKAIVEEKPPTEETPEEKRARELREKQTELTTKAFSILGGGIPQLGQGTAFIESKLRPALVPFFENLAKKYNIPFSPKSPIAQGTYAQGVSPAAMATQLLKEEIPILIAQGEVEKAEEIRNILKDMEGTYEEITSGAQTMEGGAFAGTFFGKESSQNFKQYGSDVNKTIAQLTEDMYDLLNAQEITSKAFNDFQSNVSNKGLTIIEVYTAMGDAARALPDSLQQTTYALAYASEEQKERILGLKSSIGELINEIEKLRQAGQTATLPNLEKELAGYQQELTDFISGMYEARRALEIQNALQVPLEIDVSSMEDFNLVVAEAMALAKVQIQEQIKLGLLPDDTTVEEVLATFEEIFIKIGDIAYTTLKIDPAFLKEAYKLAEAAGRITVPEEPGRIQIKQFDTTRAAFEAAYDKMFNFIKNSFPDWQPDIQTIGAIFTDGTATLHLDNLIMQLAMQELIDVNKKQLEGVYNLPADSSFFVPFQGYKLGFGEGGTGGAASDLSAAADELSDAAKAIRDSIQPTETLTEVMRSWFGTGLNTVLPQPTEEKTFAEIAKEWFGAQLNTVLPEPGFPQKDELATSEYEQGFFATLAEDFKNFFTTTLPGLIGKTGTELSEGFENDPWNRNYDPEAETSLESFINRLTSALKSLLPEETPDFMKPPDFLNPFGDNQGTSIFQNLGAAIDILNQKAQTIAGFTTNLKIDSNTTVQLVVDGRTLATIIKPYLYADMIRFEATAGSVTRNVVV